MFKPKPELNDGWYWRHQISSPPSPPRFENESQLDAAWRSLVLIHTTFRATDQGEYGQIVKTLREIERMFLEHPSLSDYYHECHRFPGTFQYIVADFTMTLLNQGVKTDYRHVAAIQARFMVDVYFVLQLARFGNALDNRGWMNLFRSWGQSGRFNVVFDNMISTFTNEFVEFYRLYIKYYPGSIEEYPIPHPWDYQATRQDPRTLAEDKVAEFLPGVFLDSGIREAGTTRGGPLPSPGAESRGVVEEESKTLSSYDNLTAYQQGGEDSGSSSGSSPAPNT